MQCNTETFSVIFLVFDLETFEEKTVINKEKKANNYMLIKKYITTSL